MNEEMQYGGIPSFNTWDASEGEFRDTSGATPSIANDYETLYQAERASGERIPYAPNDPQELTWLRQNAEFRIINQDWGREGVGDLNAPRGPSSFVGYRQLPDGRVMRVYRDGSMEENRSNEGGLGGFLGNVAKYGSLGMLAFTGGGVLTPALGAVGAAAAGGAISGGIAGGTASGSNFSGSGALKGAIIGGAAGAAGRYLGGTMGGSAGGGAGDVGIDYAIPNTEAISSGADITGIAAGDVGIDYAMPNTEPVSSGQDITTASYRDVVSGKVPLKSYLANLVTKIGMGYAMGGGGTNTTGTSGGFTMNESTPNFSPMRRKPTYSYSPQQGAVSGIPSQYNRLM